MSKTWYDKAKKAKTFEDGMNFVIGRDKKLGKYVPVIAETTTAAGKEPAKFQKEVCDKQGLERIKSMVGRLTSVGIMVADADAKILSSQFLKEAKAEMPAPWKTKLSVVLPSGEVLASASDEDAAPENEANAAPDPQIEALRKRLAALLPKINALEGDMAEKLQASAKTAKEQIDVPNVEAATATLDGIEKALKSLGAGGSDGALKQLAAKLAELKPQVAAVAPEQAKALKEVWEQAAQNVRDKDAANAAKRIKTLATALAKLGNGADPAEKEWKALLAKLTPAVTEAIKSGQNGADKYREALAAGVAKAKAKDYAGAIAIGKKLAAALGKARAETAANGTFEPRWKAARATWNSAIETVDGQITKLQAALNTFDDPELKEISQFGLNAITSNHKVLMMAALQDVTAAGADPDKKVLSTAAKRIAAFDSHLSSDPRVKAVDTNPFGVQMSLASTLRPALAGLGKVLQSAV